MVCGTQQTVWSWDPDAFGVLQPRAGLPNGVEINLRFPGQYYDSKSGLHYNLNRYYNPELGRYMEPDPIGLKGGLNPYAYAGNGPVNKVDPSGLISMLNDAGLSGSFGAPDLNMNSMFNQQLNQYQANVASLRPNVTLALNSSYPTNLGRPYQQFSSPVAAGVAAVMHINPTSIAQNQEYGGLIYGSSSGSSFFFNSPTSGGNASVNPFSNYEYKSGWSVVGTYYTHGAYSRGHDNENFSGIPGDLVPAFGTGMGNYRFLGTPSGAVKM